MNKPAHARLHLPFLLTFDSIRDLTNGKRTKMAISITVPEVTASLPFSVQASS